MSAPTPPPTARRISIARETRPQAPPEPLARRDPIRLFIQNLEAVGGQVHRLHGGEVREWAAAELKRRGADTVLAWSDGDPLLAEVLGGLRQTGIDVVEPHIPWGDPSVLRDAWRSLSRHKIGLTGAIAGLADTGTLVLPGGPGRAQSASLLPEVHLALLSTQDIFPSMEAWLAGGGKQALASAAASTLITGPSRTADIEMTLTTGVHGPGELIVVCVD